MKPKLFRSIGKVAKAKADVKLKRRAIGLSCIGLTLATNFRSPSRYFRQFLCGKLNTGFPFCTFSFRFKFQDILVLTLTQHFGSDSFSISLISACSNASIFVFMATSTKEPSSFGIIGSVLKQQQRFHIGGSGSIISCAAAASVSSDLAVTTVFVVMPATATALRVAAAVHLWASALSAMQSRLSATSTAPFQQPEIQRQLFIFRDSIAGVACLVSFISSSTSSQQRLGDS